MKTLWKRREKPTKSGLLKKDQKTKSLWFCDQIFSWVLPLYVNAADLTVRTCWIWSRYEFFEAFSHLGPLLKRPR